MERQTVSIMKACEMVGVSRRTIYNWIAAGKVEYVRTAGGSIRIFTDTLWRQPDSAGRALTTPAAEPRDSFRIARAIDPRILLRGDVCRPAPLSRRQIPLSYSSARCEF
jgi:excisionase family DNA binding protein